MAEPLPPSEYRRGHLPADVYLRRRPRTRGLHRVLGVPGLFSTAYGDVGSSIYYALGVTALIALGLTPLAFIIAGLFYLATSLTYSEGTAAMPVAGGSSSFARRGFRNELLSFLAAWALALNYIVTMAISAFTVPNYLAVFIPFLGEWPANSLFAIALLAGLATVNIVGLRASSRVNIGLALLDLVTQALIVLLGLLLLFNIKTIIDNIHWGTAPSWPQLIHGVAIAMIAFTGIETVSNLAEETRNPAKNVPRSVLSVFGAVMVMYTLIPLVALSAMPVYQADGQFVTDLGTKFIQDPVIGVVKQFPQVLQRPMEVWVALLAATILTIATNAGMLGLSRLSYSMGHHQQLPSVVSRLHPRRRTPANAIIIFVAFTALLVLTGRVEILANAYSFGAMLTFTFAHLSIIALRVREPALPRPFKIGLNIPIKGRQIPLPAVVGALGTSGAWLIVVYTQAEGRIIGFAWLALGLAVYLIYRRSQGLSPWKSEETKPP